MAEPKAKKAKPSPEDYEPYVDPIGVTHFLPPKKCKNCD
jgi:hypothetical protein